MVLSQREKGKGKVKLKKLLKHQLFEWGDESRSKTGTNLCSTKQALGFLPQEREESLMSMKGESSMTRFEFFDDREWFGRRQR